MKKRLNFSAYVLLICVSVFAASAVFSQTTTEKVNALLNDIQTYDFGQSRAALSELSDLMKDVLDSQADKAAAEKAMISFLKTDATFAGKQFVCKQLSIIGTSESVPVLSELLKNSETSDIALYALERIPGTAVDDALLAALGKSKGNVKVGIINTLGQRKTASAVKSLEKTTGDKNAEIAGSSLAALGKIATTDAADALAKVVKKSKGDLKALALDAWLQSADGLAAKNKDAAVKIYESVYENEKSTPARIAALRGMVATSGAGAVDILVKALDKDVAIQTAAIGLVKELPAKSNLEPLIAKLDKLSEMGQVRLLTALADRREVGAKTAVLSAVKSNDEQIKIAALKALSRIGDDSDVDLLAEIAANSSADVKEAAQLSLDRLDAPAVDKKIISSMNASSSKIKAELVRSAGARNIKTATDMLLKTAKDNDRVVRREAFKALATLSTPDNFDELINLTVNEENNTIRQEAVKTLVAVALMIDGDRGEKIRKAAEKEENIEAKSALLQALGRLGDQQALTLMRKNLNSDNVELQKAAVRALALWTDTSPIDDLLTIAKATDDGTVKILALRGYLDLLKLDSRRNDEESLVLYKVAMDLAGEVSEQRMVLSGVSELRSINALTMVASYLGNENLKREAEVAATEIGNRVYQLDPAYVTEIMNKVLKQTDNDSVINTANKVLQKINS